MNKKVPVQKGEIRVPKCCGKFSARVEKTAEDMANHDLRKSGQTLHIITPK